MQEFIPRDPIIQLNKLLKVSNLVSSGGEAKQLILAGEVKVDGAVELRIRCQIKPGSVVTLGTKSVKVVTAG